MSYIRFKLQSDSVNMVEFSEDGKQLAVSNSQNKLDT